MPEDKAKQRLLSLLERRVFNPVLRASPKRYSQEEQKLLERVKDKTVREKERYHDYPDAAYVRQQFVDDLRSEPAKRVQANLKRLRLPALPDIKDEFLKLADKLGVAQGRRGRTQHRPHPPHPQHSKRAYEQIEERSGKEEADKAAKRAAARERQKKKKKAPKRATRRTAAARKRERAKTTSKRKAARRKKKPSRS